MSHGDRLVNSNGIYLKNCAAISHGYPELFLGPCWATQHLGKTKLLKGWQVDMKRWIPAMKSTLLFVYCNLIIGAQKRIQYFETKYNMSIVAIDMQLRPQLHEETNNGLKKKMQTKGIIRCVSQKKKKGIIRCSHQSIF